MDKTAYKIDSRNKQWDLMRAIAIIFVVWGHNYQPPFIFFPAFYFHISLFFFISGYFFRPRIAISDKVKFFYRKTVNQLLPYFVFNLFFGILTLWLSSMKIYLGLTLTFETMFISPFGRGDQFALYLPAWFLLNLYFISIVSCLIYQKNNKANIGIVTIFSILMIFLLNRGNSSNMSMWEIFLIRSVFGFCFVGFGYLFHLVESRIQKFIINPVTILVLYLIIDVLAKNFGIISYSILFGNVGNSLVIVPIITSLCIIFIVYSFAFYATKVLQQNSFIYEIGQYSYSIMIFHLSFFLMFNLLLFKLSLIPYTSLSDVYFRYNVEKIWFLYQLPAIVLPVLMAKTYNAAKQKSLALTKVLWSEHWKQDTARRDHGEIIL